MVGILLLASLLLPARPRFWANLAMLAAWSYNGVDITAVYHPLKYVLPFLTALAVAWPPRRRGRPPGRFTAEPRRRRARREFNAVFR